MGWSPDLSRGVETGLMGFNPDFGRQGVLSGSMGEREEEITDIFETLNEKQRTRQTIEDRKDKQDKHLKNVC